MDERPRHASGEKARIDGFDSTRQGGRIQKRASFFAERTGAAIDQSDWANLHGGGERKQSLEREKQINGLQLKLMVPSKPSKREEKPLRACGLPDE